MAHLSLVFVLYVIFNCLSIDSIHDIFISQKLLSKSLLIEKEYKIKLTLSITSFSYLYIEFDLGSQ